MTSPASATFQGEVTSMSMWLRKRRAHAIVGEPTESEIIANSLKSFAKENPELQCSLCTKVCRNAQKLKLHMDAVHSLAKDYLKDCSAFWLEKENHNLLTDPSTQETAPNEASQGLPPENCKFELGKRRVEFESVEKFRYSCKEDVLTNAALMEEYLIEKKLLRSDNKAEAMNLKSHKAAEKERSKSGDPALRIKQSQNIGGQLFHNTGRASYSEKMETPRQSFESNFVMKDEASQMDKNLGAGQGGKRKSLADELGSESGCGVDELPRRRAPPKLSERKLEKRRKSGLLLSQAFLEDTVREPGTTPADEDELVARTSFPRGRIFTRTAPDLTDTILPLKYSDPKYEWMKEAFSLPLTQSKAAKAALKEQQRAERRAPPKEEAKQPVKESQKMATAYSFAPRKGFVSEPDNPLTLSVLRANLGGDNAIMRRFSLFKVIRPQSEAPFCAEEFQSVDSVRLSLGGVCRGSFSLVDSPEVRLRYGSNTLPPMPQLQDFLATVPDPWGDYYRAKKFSKFQLTPSTLSPHSPQLKRLAAELPKSPERRPQPRNSETVQLSAATAERPRAESALCGVRTPTVAPKTEEKGFTVFTVRDRPARAVEPQLLVQQSDTLRQSALCFLCEGKVLVFEDRASLDMHILETHCVALESPFNYLGPGFGWGHSPTN